MKVLLVDVYNMIYRAKYGFARGDNSTIFGFFRSLKSEITRHSPDLVYLVLEGHPKHRFVLNENYKANRVREPDDDFQRQKEEIFALSHFLPVTIARHPDYECDDVIAHMCTQVHPTDSVVIVSSDTDFIQLLESDDVSLWNPIKKKFIEPWPVDYVTWKALKGDPADNIPGVRGIGAKRAHVLCEDWTTLEDFLAAKPERREVFESAKAQIRFASLDRELDLLEISSNFFDEERIKNAFTEYGFKSIIGKAWFKWQTTMEGLNDKLSPNADC